MALSLAQGSALVDDPAFLARIRQATVKAAEAVIGESQGSMTTDGWAKRHQLAVRILNGPDSMVRAFAVAVAADPGNALTWWSPVPIASSTTDNPAVITTSGAHGLWTGHVAAITGHATNTPVNGVWEVTAIDATSFTVPVPGLAAGGATGVVQRHESDANLTFTVNSVFGDMAGLMAGEG